MNIKQLRKVKVVAYDPDWPRAFCIEAEAIRSVMGTLVVEINHIGSTSIPNAAAKPIIDMMLVVTDIKKVDTLTDQLATLGYIAKGEYGIPGRRFFTKDNGGERTHHLHIFQSGNPEINRHLAFRDYMRSHPDGLEVYSRLKTDLARRYPLDIESYMDGKDAFIKGINRKAAIDQSFRPKAILLLGPTGSGKTPLGELLEKESFAGKKCFHFDFGDRLRRSAAKPTGLLSDAELADVNNSLHTGVLLTDEQFLIAEKLLGGFIEETGVSRSGLIVLNGLPRHSGQAAALEKIVRMMAVVILDCNAATVLERIRTDAGGDRGNRVDDTIEQVRRKLDIFNEKTLPLVEYYQKCGVRIVRFTVDAYSTAADTRKALANQLNQTLG